MSSDPTSSARPTGSLVGDALHHLSSLVRGEIALARSELSESLRTARKGITMVLLAVVIAGVALNQAASALSIWLVQFGLQPAIAALIVGCGLGLLALVLAVQGGGALDTSRLALRRTAESVRRDAETIKETMTNDTAR